MANVLEKIVADKRLEVAQREQNFPTTDFIEHLVPTQKSFYQALAAPNASFILECKKASPSKGLIRDVFDLDEIIEAYSPHAACISVLTDEKYFQGTFEYLQYVTERVNQPVINKDFFVEPYQVHLARYCGADAILLMLSVLDDGEYRALAALAAQYKMDVLTEVSNEQEMQRAIELKANIIGINNRNLRDLSTDLATTERLVPMLKNVDFPHVVISESGIYTHNDVKRLAPICDGFLVGSALMAQDDLPSAVSELLYPATKVCGITRAEDARFLSNMPTQYVGLIFAPKSPRAIDLATAKSIVNAVSHQYVGVFVNEVAEQVAQIAKELNLAAVQLHGEESLTYIEKLRALLAPNCQIWKAVGIESDRAMSDHPQAITEPGNPLWASVDRVLLDCKVGEQSGGTGQSFDWGVLAQLPHSQQLILAGGINENNAVAAINACPAGIDINSGVEDAPGIKNSNKLEALYERLRAY